MKEFLNPESADRRIGEVLSHAEKPQNEREHQIALAMELYARDHSSAAMRIENGDFRNEMGSYWADNKYAKAFRDLITHPDFKAKKNYRLKGNILNVTLSDVEYFLHNEKPPEL